MKSGGMVVFNQRLLVCYGGFAPVLRGRAIACFQIPNFPDSAEPPYFIEVSVKADDVLDPHSPCRKGYEGIVKIESPIG